MCCSLINSGKHCVNLILNENHNICSQTDKVFEDRDKWLTFFSAFPTTYYLRYETRKIVCSLTVTETLCKEIPRSQILFSLLVFKSSLCSAQATKNSFYALAFYVWLAHKVTFLSMTVIYLLSIHAQYLRTVLSTIQPLIVLMKHRL